MVNPIFNNKELKKGLYLISTPIGNLGDISFRAIDLLKNSDFILCEDTRISKKLLDKFEIKTRLVSNYKFNDFKTLNKPPYKKLNTASSNKLTLFSTTWSVLPKPNSYNESLIKGIFQCNVNCLYHDTSLTGMVRMRMIF